MKLINLITELSFLYDEVGDVDIEVVIQPSYPLVAPITDIVSSQNAVEIITGEPTRYANDNYNY